MVGGQEVDGACVLLFNADNPLRRLSSRLCFERDVHMGNVGAIVCELIVVAEVCIEVTKT